MAFPGTIFPYGWGWLQVALFSPRHATFIAHHDMIQYPGSDHVERVLEGGGQRTIGLARLRVAGGMVVNQNHCRGVVLQGDLDHLPRVHAGTIQRASEQLPKPYNPVLGVEQQQCKDFVLMVLQQCLEKTEYVLRLSQCSAFRQTTHRELLSHLQDVSFGDW